MIKDSIKITCEFKTRTPLGIADCEVDMRIFENVREQTARAVDWCMKAMKCKSVSSPMITFTYGDGSLYGVSTSRVYYDFCDKYGVVKWKGNETFTYDDMCPNKALFTHLYLECVESMEKREEASA